ncbi:hypothetical protein [Marinicella rhabdoformis]|uniref:hypothetical protein n=1 Tax=Marinicella rhabdoformis TaxID=2580566 RepID=UPI0012AEBB8C|nr:hypothetical protein [Marinicella rhabdoformis]
MKQFLVVLACLYLAACVEKGEDKSVESKDLTENKVTLKACTKELKICPDGSGVGRNSANNCEFDACPETKPQNSAGCTDDVKQCPDGSFVSRDPLKSCAFKACQELPVMKKSEPMMCTQEVKQCPNGSHVGRDPNNNCAFSPCPKDSANLQ